MNKALANKNFDKADEIAESVLQSKPEHYKCLTVRGICAIETKQHKIAEVFLKKAVDLHPERLPAWMQLVTVYQALGDNADCLKAISRILSLLKDTSALPKNQKMRQMRIYSVQKSQLLRNMALWPEAVELLKEIFFV